MVCGTDDIISRQNRAILNGEEVNHSESLVMACFLTSTLRINFHFTQRHEFPRTKYSDIQVSSILPGLAVKRGFVQSGHGVQSTTSGIQIAIAIVALKNTLNRP